MYESANILTQAAAHSEKTNMTMSCSIKNSAVLE